MIRNFSLPKSGTRPSRVLTFCDLCVLVSFMTTAHAIDPTTNGHVRELSALDTAGGGAAPADEAMQAMGVQLERLRRLQDIGEKIADRLGRQAEMRIPRPVEGQPSSPGEDLSLAFSRLSRSMLQLMSMEQVILGLRTTRMLEVRAEREERTRQPIRRAVMDLFAERLPDADPDYLRDLMDGIFRQHEDCSDLDTCTVEKMLARVCDQLHIDRDPELWPDTLDEVDEADEDESALSEARGNGHDPP